MKRKLFTASLLAVLAVASASQSSVARADGEMSDSDQAALFQTDNPAFDEMNASSGIATSADAGFEDHRGGGFGDHHGGGWGGHHGGPGWGDHRGPGWGGGPRGPGWGWGDHRRGWDASWRWGYHPQGHWYRGIPWFFAPGTPITCSAFRPGFPQPFLAEGFDGPLTLLQAYNTCGGGFAGCQEGTCWPTYY